MKKVIFKFALLAIVIIGSISIMSCKKGDENIDNKPEAGNIINGHEYVDLGLPSGLKWATCNIGANQPHEYGNYYAWGETSTKNYYTDRNSLTFDVWMNDISGDTIYDAARANWGGTWRIPTKTEMKELIDSCSWNWTTQNGINGMNVTGPNGKSIFLPATGYCYNTTNPTIGDSGLYWSSTPFESNVSAYYLDFNSYRSDMGSLARFAGVTVRPVSD